MSLSRELSFAKIGVPLHLHRIRNVEPFDRVIGVENQKVPQLSPSRSVIAAASRASSTRDAVIARVQLSHPIPHPAQTLREGEWPPVFLAIGLRPRVLASRPGWNKSFATVMAFVSF